MQEISETLNIGGQVVNVHVEIAEPEPIAAPVAVAPQEEPRKEEKKLSQKLSSPAVKPDPGPRPQANGDATSGAAHVAWLNADRAFKESQPLPISDGGKGVSN
jgi:hypothetical protein